MSPIFNLMRIMGKVIEVYVKNMTAVVGTEQAFYTVCPGHECTRTPATFAKTEKVLPEADKSALSLSLALAEENKFNVKVHNLSTWRGKLRARLKGVEKTPTIIIGNHRIEDAITKDRLLSML